MDDNNDLAYNTHYKVKHIQSWMTNFTLSRLEQAPLRFLGMFISIRERTIVIADVTKQILHRPSSITAANTSAFCVGSQAVSDTNS